MKASALSLAVILRGAASHQLPQTGPAQLDLDGLEDAVDAIKELIHPDPDLGGQSPPNEGADRGYTHILGEMEDGGVIYGDTAHVQPGMRGLLHPRPRLPECYTGWIEPEPLEQGYSNWFGTVENYAPVFRVKTDKELRKIVTKSAERVGPEGRPKCRVRAKGSGHSEDGLIMQRTEDDVVAVSLVDHVPDHPDWSTPSINVETGRLRVLAGMTFYEAVPIYRPKGFLLRERPPLRLFTIGGVVSNMVHGGSNTGGFVNSDVTKLLVMLSSGEVTEVEGDDLRYWRAGYGLLGIILAVEWQLVSEAQAGLNMQRSSPNFAHLIPNPIPSPNQVQDLIAAVTDEVKTISRDNFNNEFFYDWYSSTLHSYFMELNGPPFQGEPGDPRTALYEASANFYLDTYGGNDLGFSGGTVFPVIDDICDFFCVPGYDPCIPIPSQTEPGKLLCEVPIELAAALNIATAEIFSQQYDAIKMSVNDGYATDSVQEFNTAIIFAPSRALPQVFGTWWTAVAAAVGTVKDPTNPQALPFQYAPNNMLEMRFINPIETPVLNPIPTFGEWKQEFDDKYAAHADLAGAPSAFDLIFDDTTMPDGLFSCEVINIKGVNDKDVDKFLALIEGLWNNMPSNPLIPYGPNPVQGKSRIVRDCDIANQITFCAPVDGFPGVFSSPIHDTLDCCNPPIPVKTTHFGKGWGYGSDPNTTPVTSKLVPFKNQAIIDSMFSSPPGKATSIQDFNNKVQELDADVFAAGSVLRWLHPDSAAPFEPRKLDGQECGSPEYAINPDAECISGICHDTELVCEGV